MRREDTQGDAIGGSYGTSARAPQRAVEDQSPVGRKRGIRGPRLGLTSGETDEETDDRAAASSAHTWGELRYYLGAS